MQKVAVIGAGTMGSGIAQVAAMHGCDVRLIDKSDEFVGRGLSGIRKQLEKAVEKGKLSTEAAESAIGRIQGGTSLEGLGGIELAIEAVIEDLEIKRELFRRLESVTSPDAVLATNTSSLSVTKIAEGVKEGSRVIGMHFFNPAAVMPLVEVVAGRQSASSAVDRAVEAARGWGKTPVRVKDTPGFIVNRVARGFYLEALRLLGEGVAGIDEIDEVMKRLGGFKMGPFELMDLIGIDVNYSVTVSVWEQMGRAARFAPHDIQRKLVEAGRLGRKTGRGFYGYDGDRGLPAYPVDRRSFQVSPLLSDAILAFTARGGVIEAGSTERFVLARILSAIINEAGHALSEEIATREDIDVAMVKGTNYPKGPLGWADEIGPRTVRGLLKALNQVASDGRYEPAKNFAGAHLSGVASEDVPRQSPLLAEQWHTERQR